MKKVFLFASFVFCLVYTLDAQNIEPGNDAQGYLNSKNMLVDYCTGIFHYTVPLFEVCSGDFKLSLSINYSSLDTLGRDPGGIVGSAWSLQTGGIVTRVIRGGIADERKDKGYIYQLPVNQLSDELVANANNHVRDGECDIFTASFRENVVHFIIKKEGNTIVAVPLERTNAKITCEYDSLTSEIKGWIVTDEDGVKFIYRVQEWTKNINRQTAVMMNNLNDEAYVSSWYLSRIEIPNANTIIYTYETEGLDINGKPVNKTMAFKHGSGDRLLYKYGKKMITFKFDFEGEKRYQFDDYLRKAENEISSTAFIQSHPELLPPGAFGSVVSQTRVDYNTLLNTGSVLGTISSFKGETFPMARVVETLNEMIRFYQYKHPVVWDYLVKAKNILTSAVCVGEVSGSSAERGGSQIVSTPLLKKISTGTEEICFDYNRWLHVVVLKDYRGIQKQKMVLDVDLHILDQVSWFGSDNELFQHQEFIYSGGLLTCLSLLPGGEVQIEYESNTCNTEAVKGKRVKSIVLEDGLCTRDTIMYHYPYPGYLVYNQISYRDTISYGQTGASDFKDIVESNSPVYKGIVYLNRGNEGVFYHYVEEELRGKGVNTYLFSVPASSGNSGERSYSFWLCGLPLGKAVYSASGQLVSLQKNTYYTDLTNSRFGFGKSWFEASPAAFNYSQNQWQVELCGYFMGGDDLLEYYRRQPKTLLYEDLDYGKAYLDPMVLYSENIDPRRDIVSPRQGYKMYYGGKTVLKSRKQYTFSGSAKGVPVITDLTGNLPEGALLVSDVEYKYDNAGLTARPTRVVRNRANGDQLVNTRRTPLEIVSTDGTIKQMQDLNMVSLAVKEQVLLLKKGSTRYLLLEESVNHYRGITGTNGQTVFLPVKTSRFIGERPVLVNTPVLAQENNNLTGDAGDYREDSCVYRVGNGEILLEELTSPGGTSAICHDQGNNRVVMSAENCARAYIDAVDKYRVLFNTAGKIRDEKIAGNTLPNYLEVSTGAPECRFVVTLLVKPVSSRLSLAYSVAGDVERDHVTGEKTVVAGKWQTVQFGIDISSGRSLKVNFPAGQVAVGVVAPLGVVYTAYSYDPAGRLFGKFDQNGSLERYEYDATGRLTKTYDRDGYLLKENNYKTLWR